MLTDPGFENGTGWTYTGLAARSTAQAYTGTYSCLLATRKGGLTTSISTVESEGFSVVSGTQYSITLYTYADGVTNTDVNVRVAADRGDGPFVNLTTIAKTGHGSGWRYSGVITFTANTTGTGRIRVFSTQTAGLLAVDNWYVDAVVLSGPSEDAVITATIKAALLADLNDIDGTGIFTTTVAEVGSEPKPSNEVQKPGVFIYSTEGEADLETLTNLRGSTVQTFTLDLVIESNTPNADMDTFLDDIRNALERTVSNTLAVDRVSNVVVTDWTPVETDPDIHMNTYYRQVNVVVSYLYSRGAA